MEPTQQSKHLYTGRKGEELAAQYLQQEGYEILAKNWKMGRKELDIIATKADELVVVEVKTRSVPVLDQPFLAVDRKKQRTIISAAHAYVRFHKIALSVRFDIIWIELYRDHQIEIDHIRDAFIPGL